MKRGLLLYQRFSAKRVRYWAFKYSNIKLPPQSNGTVERLQRFLHSGLSHNVNASNTNWHVLTPFFLMVYRATPNTVTGYSPFHFLNWRELQIPNQDNLRAKISAQLLHHNKRIKSLKASLRLANKSVRQAKRKAHQNNKRLYNRSAKFRTFEAVNQVYLYNPAVKLGTSKKFHFPWSGPFEITAKIYLEL